jgi:predicted SnoaL-like aldol condensation-catalyzing enzyme
MPQTLEEKNKALVLEAFENAFNKRDAGAYARYWAPDYIQHSKVARPGREGLRELLASLPATMRYEPGLAVASGDYVMVHGRLTNMGQPKALIVVDILRIANGRLAEHWDVIQDEATEAESKSDHPMFGDTFSNV